MPDANGERLRDVEFTTHAFIREVTERVGLECCQIPTPQIRYLADYLSHALHAERMVVESPYTDRHYIEEYSVYYSTLLHPPSTRTTRLHFFSYALEGTFTDALNSAAGGDGSDAEARLQEAYLGFIVVRPFAAAPIGRTVLRHLDGDRDFKPAAVRNTVHLAGFELFVEGLPFQQQDQGVGACATTALWSMLASASRQNGRRTPLPGQITNAAMTLAHRNRRFPAMDGLTAEQMVTAIDALGFTPRYFSSDDGDELFLVVLLCYLRSGFPVVVHLGDEGVGHTVCAVGYSADAKGEAWMCDLGGGLSLRFRGVRRIYAHEDRLGPYARYDFLRRDPTATGLKEPRFKLAIKYDHEQWAATRFGNAMNASHGIVALYPKIRLSARELIDAAVDWVVLAADVGVDPLVEFRFQLSGHYLRHRVRSARLPAERAATFAAAADLSRYVGVISLREESGDPFVDVLVDATDICRDGPFAGVLAVVPFSENMTSLLKQLRDKRGIPDHILIA